MPFFGDFSPPGDKSVSHRLVLMSLIAHGEMCVQGLSDSQDVRHSLEIFKALGGQARHHGSSLSITGLKGDIPLGAEYDLDCGNSGTTMRLLCGILAALPGNFLLDGDQQLRRRPMERVADPLRQMGARISTSNGRPPVRIQGGPLHGFDYQLPVSSAQIKGAIILAALSASGGTRLTEPLPSRDHTERLALAFGARLKVGDRTVEVQPGSLTLPEAYQVPADPSAAAFFLTGAACLPESRVTARGILLSSARVGFLRVLDRMGASVSISLSQEHPEPSGDVTVSYQGPLQAVEIGPEEIPSIIDELPILALAAAWAQGLTIFRQVGELRVKETDRLLAIKHQLGALGARVRIDGDDLMVEGPTSIILPEALDSGGDHRLAMTLHLALALAGAQRPVLGDDSIAVSYPDFLADLAALWRN